MGIRFGWPASAFVCTASTRQSRSRPASPAVGAGDAGPRRPVRLRGVSPLAPASCRRRGPRGHARGCAGGGADLRVGVRSRSTRDSRASNSGCSPRFREISGARGARATTRLPFSARPQPAPGGHPISHALVDSARGVDPIHRDRCEGGPVDAAFVEDRLHPLRGPSNAAPGLLGVLRIAVLRWSLAPGAAGVIGRFVPRITSRAHPGPGTTHESSPDRG